MKKLMNITEYDEDLGRYRDGAELEGVLTRFGLSGLEVLPSGLPTIYPLPQGKVIGVHMRCQSDFLDFWRRDREQLDREYGGRESWQAMYGEDPREALLVRAREDLDYALSHQAEYVVFHVSQVRATDVLTQEFPYTDEEVLEAAALFIEELLKDREPSFDFLVENLWWPGMRLRDGRQTKEFLERISYPRKGLMLDIGHYLHTNSSLRTQKEAVGYVDRMLDGHRELFSLIRGVHLHQTLEGAYAEEFRAGKHPVPEEYTERFCRAMDYISRIDAHEPFTDPGVLGLLSRIQPEYLTLEFLSRDRREQEEKMNRQLRLFEGA